MFTRHQPANRALADAIGMDRKGWLSIALYIAAIAMSLPLPLIGFLLYVVVAIMWLVPDRRIERRLHDPA